MFRIVILLILLSIVLVGSVSATTMGVNHSVTVTPQANGDLQAVVHLDLTTDTPGTVLTGWLFGVTPDVSGIHYDACTVNPAVSGFPFVSDNPTPPVTLTGLFVNGRSTIGTGYTFTNAPLADWLVMSFTLPKALVDSVQLPVHLNFNFSAPDYAINTTTGDFNPANFSVPVPEPLTLALLAGGLGLIRRRR